MWFPMSVIPEVGWHSDYTLDAHRCPQKVVDIENHTHHLAFRFWQDRNGNCVITSEIHNLRSGANGEISILEVLHICGVS